MALQFQKLNSNFVGLYRVQNKTDLVKPKIFKSVSEYLSNESEKSNFHSGKQKLWPNEFSERSLWKLYSP